MKNVIFSLFLSFLIISCSDGKPEIAVLENEFIPGPDTILISKPKNYSADKQYPLVILLHGWSGDYKQWNSITYLQDYSNAYNFIIACPDGFYDSWYINNPQKPDVQYEDFFWKEFIPYLINQYSIDTTNIFITGLSMGGHGAITLYLKRPEYFNCAGSTSGILDLTYFPDRWSIKDGIGSIKEYPNIWEDNSAIHILDSARHADTKMIIDCGTSDFAYNVNLNFVKKCIDLGIDVEFLSVPGDHNRKHWKTMIAKHFEFFFRQIKTQ